MNNKININPSSTKWLEKDDRVVADYFCDLGFRSLKQILDMRVFDLMNMQGLDAVRVEEIIICLYKWLNPNTDIDEAIYIGTMTQPFPYGPWRKKHRDLSEVKVRDLVLAPDINMQAIQHFYDSMLPQLLFLLYARRMDLRVYFDSDKLTGMSIEIVLPDIRLAIDMESERKTLTKEKMAKLHVCEAKHYDYILLKPCSDPKAMAEQILRVFKMKHIFIPTNVDEDIRQAQTAFLNLMRLEIESTSET